MIQSKCVNKQRDKNGQIIGYLIEDMQGKSMYIDPARLKQLIQSGQLDVVNLTLTSDGRLVDAAKTPQVTPLNIPLLSEIHKFIIDTTYGIMGEEGGHAFGTASSNDRYTNQKIIDLPVDNKDSARNGLESVMTYSLPAGAILVRVNTLSSNNKTFVYIAKAIIGNRDLINPESYIWRNQQSVTFELSASEESSKTALYTKLAEQIKVLDDKAYEHWVSDQSSVIKRDNLCSKLEIDSSEVERSAQFYESRIKTLKEKNDKLHDPESSFFGNGYEDIRITVVKRWRQRSDLETAKMQLNKLKGMNGTSNLRVEPGEGYVDITKYMFTSSGYIKVTNLDTGIEQNVPNELYVLDTILNSHELSITENEFVYNEKENRWLSRSGYKAAKTMNSIKTSAMGAYGEASKFVNKAMEDPKGTANKALNKTEDATRKAISGIRGFIDRISN